MSATKQCRDCEQVLPVSKFQRARANRDGLDSYCRPCRNERQRRRRSKRSQEERDQVRQKNREWHHRTKGSLDRDRKIRSNRLRHRYGIDLDEFEEMLELQGGLCGVCQRGMDRLVVDHDHKTGAVRGLLCVTCNAHLGVIENREWVEKAEAYLRRVQEQ